MARRFAPFWWPIFMITSPVLIPFLAIRYVGFKRRQARADALNRQRISGATPLELPLLERLDVTPVVEWEAGEGFRSAPGVSYFVRTDHGALLFDVGFGPQDGVLRHNAGKLGISWKDMDALVISHLHMDHMGGETAARQKRVMVPEELGDPSKAACYITDEAETPGFTSILTTKPGVIPAGMGTTGPLARSLFLMGWCEEQVVVGHLKGKGLVVFVGCGHPGIETILEMVGKVSREPLYALIGGLHYPLTASRLKKPGLEAVMVFGTGKPPWRRITDADLTSAISAINRAAPRHVLVSAHDSCDHALARFAGELTAETRVLRAGQRYELRHL